MKHPFLTTPHSYTRTPRTASPQFQLKDPLVGSHVLGDRIVGLAIAAIFGFLLGMLVFGG